MTMSIDVAAALKGLQLLTVTQLRDRYAEVFGEATRSFNKQHLVKRIIWRLQALHEGGLSERARRRARELANDADIRIRPPPIGELPDSAGLVATSPFRAALDDRLPMPGALIQRSYKGQLIRVRVLDKGFEFEGEVHRSLSAIARMVTGAHWNGYHFFGLKKPTQETAST
jgi:hypothetical protein